MERPKLVMPLFIGMGIVALIFLGWASHDLAETFGRDQARVVNWSTVEPDSPYDFKQPADVAEFASRVAAVLVDRVDPADVDPEVLEQIVRFATGMLIEAEILSSDVDKLNVMFDIWLPVISGLVDQVLGIIDATFP